MLVALIIVSVLFVLVTAIANSAITDYNELSQSFIMLDERHEAYVEESEERLEDTQDKLTRCRYALNDIANQNQGQQAFEIWAKKRAQDTLERTK